MAAGARWRRRYGGGGVLLTYAPGAVTNPTPTFTRATTAIYRDVATVRQTAGVNVLRDGHYVAGVRTTLLEIGSTNHFVTPGTPATQTSPSLATGSYTLWMEGTGSIAVAGATATITGAGTASAGVNVTFVVTVAGTVTYTVTGSPTLAQSENLAFATSYNPTGVARSPDRLELTLANTPAASTWYVKFVEGGAIATNGARVFQMGTSGSNSALYILVNAAVYAAGMHNGTTLVSSAALTAPVIGDTVELSLSMTAAGVIQLSQSINGAAAVSGPASAANALGGSWNNSTLGVANLAGGSYGTMALQSLKVTSGVKTLTDMRAL